MEVEKVIIQLAPSPVEVWPGGAQPRDKIITITVKPPLVSCDVPGLFPRELKLALAILEALGAAGY